MLEQPLFAITDPAAIRRVIADHGWATLVTDHPEAGLVVSHLPVICAPDTDAVAVYGHLARKDAEHHGLGRHHAVLIVQGPHGYISPTFYGDGGPYVSTWNFVVVHLHGIPEPSGDRETYDILEATTEHFESVRHPPWRLDSVTPYAKRIAPSALGFRLDPLRVVAKAKLSQDKPAEVVDRVIAALETDASHAQPELARTMRDHVRR